MLNDLTSNQTELATYMSDLSEKAYCAGWMEGLEYALWQVAEGTRSDYGRANFTAHEASELRRLSDACGGWIVFNGDSEETWIPKADWVRRFSVWDRDPARRGDG